MSYTLRRTVETTDALRCEGLSVLCDIAVQAIVAETLDESFGQYRIRGACTSWLAREGPKRQIELGAWLPCTVIVYESDDGPVSDELETEAAA